jgi:hypothetical protein
MSLDSDFDQGFAIMIINDPSIWKPSPNKTVCDSFCLTDGSTKYGNFEWREIKNWMIKDKIKVPFY